MAIKNLDKSLFEDNKEEKKEGKINMEPKEVIDKAIETAKNENKIQVILGFRKEPENKKELAFMRALDMLYKKAFLDNMPKTFEDAAHKCASIMATIRLTEKLTGNKSLDFDLIIIAPDGKIKDVSYFEACKKIEGEKSEDE